MIKGDREHGTEIGAVAGASRRGEKRSRMEAIGGGVVAGEVGAYTNLHSLLKLLTRRTQITAPFLLDEPCSMKANWY
jgi:hypothetical protein